MKLRSLIQQNRNGRTVHPGESFRVADDEAPGLIAAGDAESLTPVIRITPRDAAQLESSKPATRHLPKAVG